jgi:hypothetical protein
MGFVDFDGIAGWPGFTWPAGARAGGEIAVGDIFAITPLGTFLFNSRRFNDLYSSDLFSTHLRH